MYKLLLRTTTSVSLRRGVVAANLYSQSCANYNNIANHNSIKKKKTMSNNSDADEAQRFIFNGHTAKPMFHLENAALPKLQNGEILVKVRTATICLSDIHTVCGTRIEPTPSVLGHEACVEVVDHKRGDSCDLKVGDRITFSIADSCGTCEFCMNGLSQKCKSLFKYGHADMKSGTGFNGCYATHIVLRKGTHVKKIPDEINDALASTINCALATVVNCVDSLPENIRKNGKTALIQGDGLLGIYSCALLKEIGFNKVYCTGHRVNRGELVKEFGGIPLYGDAKLDHELNCIDCIIEVCGNSDVVPDGIKLLKPGGAYIFAGMVFPKTQLNITGEQIIRKCLTLKGVHNYDRAHLDKAVDFLQSAINKYPFEKIVSPNVFNLVDLPSAMDDAKAKNYARICVKP